MSNADWDVSYCEECEECHLNGVCPLNLKQEDTMKKMTTKATGAGLKNLLGKRVTLFCLNYIYTGKLMSVNRSCVLLHEAAIVYETGELTSETWKDVQRLPRPWYVQIGCIESFGLLKF